MQSTKLCKEQNCAKHKSAQSTNLCKAQNCSKRACNTWTLVVCRLELFLLCNFKRLCNSSRLRGSFAMDPLLEVQFSENSGGSSGESMHVQCRSSGGCFDARSCHKHSLSQPSPYHLLTPIFTYTSTLDTLLTQIYLHLLSLEHSIHTKIIPPRFEKCILHSHTHTSSPDLKSKHRQQFDLWIWRRRFDHHVICISRYPISHFTLTFLCTQSHLLKLNTMGHKVPSWQPEQSGP